MDNDKHGFVNKGYEASAEDYYAVPKRKNPKLQDDVKGTKKSIDKRCRNFTNVANTVLSKLRDDEEFDSKTEIIRNSNDNLTNENSEDTENGLNSKVNYENNFKLDDLVGENGNNTENGDANKDTTQLNIFTEKTVSNYCNKYDFSITEEIISEDVLCVCKTDDKPAKGTDTTSDSCEILTPIDSIVDVKNIYEIICKCNSHIDTESNSENFDIASSQSASSREDKTLSNVKDEKSANKTESAKKDVSANGSSMKSLIFSDDNFVKSQNVLKDLEEDICYRFKGSARSFKEKKAKWAWMRSLQREARTLKDSTPELNRSQYSLVSCGELTAGAVQLWLGLPEEVKYDPALAAFRQLYDKEYGTANSKSNGQAGHRLPMVKSAPHLNNNIQVISEEDYLDGKMESQKEKEDKLLDSSTTVHSKHSMFYKARHYTKMTLLIACWIFFTAVFLMYNEKEEIVMKSSVSSAESKYYMLNASDASLRILVKLSGPFLSEQAEQKLNSTQMNGVNKMKLYLERWKRTDGITPTGRPNMKKQFSKSWIIVLQDDKDLDFNTGEKRSSILTLEAVSTNETTANLSSANQRSEIILRIKTTANKTVPFSMSYTLNPLDIKSGVIYACILLVGLYVLIIFEIINRTMAAVLISTTSLAALALAGERPTVSEVISWLDVETLLLLFSMMLLVAIMAETGMFDFLAVFTFQVTKGKLWPLITTLCAITALLSTFLDNVTTVLLMTPVTIRLCEVMGLDPIPILMSMVIFSNIGGTATPVGDPPNVIIASNKAVIQAGINFTNFTMHMTLGILLVCIQTYFQLRYIYRDTNKLRLNVPRDIQDLRHQLSIWRRAADSLPHLSKDQHIVRERLERKMKKLQVQLEAKIKESHKRAIPKEDFQSTLDELKEKYKIRDKGLLIKSSVALTFVVAVFFLHSIPELNRVSLGWTALLGAILLLVLADREDLEPILHRVEWSTLLFFAALFVLMEALSKLGLIQYIGGITEDLILMVDEKARLAVALLLMLWVSGLTSAFVDNIPLTTMMVRIVTSLGSNSNVNLPMAPLIWALAFGACLGGNGTLIGASANVVCAGVAEQHGYKFTFMQFFKIGFPVMIGHLVVASAYLIMCHYVFTWH